MTGKNLVVWTLLGILVHASMGVACAKPPLKRIAHAGGGFDSLTYTNSIDALNVNASSYELFEIDFAFTRDGELVCIHDWKDSANKTFGKSFSPAPTLAEFEMLVSQNTKFKNCTLKTLRIWLKTHPGKKIVTDVKGDNLKALTLIAKRFPRYQEMFVPQIYRPEEYVPARNLGYKEIIWTLYRYAGTSESILHKAGSMRIYAVTMPADRAKSGLARQLDAKLGIQSYVHTINTREELSRYRSLGIAEIYTDWLPD